MEDCADLLHLRLRERFHLEREFFLVSSHHPSEWKVRKTFIFDGKLVPRGKVFKFS